MNLSAKNLLKKFPKKRISLSRPLRKIFDIEYKKNRNNFLSQLSESWLHFSIKGRSSNLDNSTLEVGAGTLNHLKYESKKNLENYSIIEPKKYLFKNNIFKNSIFKIYKNFSKLPKKKFDRIISCAVLEHLEDLPKFLAISGLAMRNNGYQSHSIPCEGYPLWKITWDVISGIPFRLRTGLNFNEIQKYEHVNNFDEILCLIKYFYNEHTVKFSYPSFFSPYLSLYANITFSKPNKISIQNYLNKKI